MAAPPSWGKSSQAGAWGMSPRAMLHLLHWVQEVDFPCAALPLVSLGQWEGGTHWRWWWDPVHGGGAGVW